MSSEWETISLGECIEITTGFPFKSSEYSDDVDDIRLLRGDNIGQGTLRWDGVKRWPVTKINSLENFELRESDIVLAMDRPWIPAGLKFGRVRKDDLPALLVQRVACLRPTQRINGDFLFSVLASGKFSDYIQNITTGTAIPHISAKQIQNYCFQLPTIDIQEQIGKFHANLDDRITLLRETNKTLESIVQAILKSWFVDFDPVHAKMEGRQPEGMDEETAALFPDSFEESERGVTPKGWVIKSLAGIYDINPPRRLRKGAESTYLEMANVPTQGFSVDATARRAFGSGTKFVNGDTLLARITPCLENGKTAFVDFLAEAEIGWGSTEFIVLRPKAPLPPFHAYLLCRTSGFRNHAIQSMSGTSGRQRVQNDVLGQFEISVPGEALADKFSAICKLIQQKITVNHSQATSLTSLRDTLLPRLISGRLRLSEAQKLAEAALT